MSRGRFVIAAVAALVASALAGHASASLMSSPPATVAAPAAVASPSAPRPTAQSAPSAVSPAPAASVVPGPTAPSGGTVPSLSRTHGQAKRSPVKLVEDFPRGSFARPTHIDNPYLPLAPGTKLVFRGWTGIGKERLPHRVEFVVTDLTKEIDGVKTVVVYEADSTDGELVEAEIIFYAQDDPGNVWLMGEYPEEYEHGRIVETPAWISGVQGSSAGILMQATPEADTPSYSQGWGPVVGWTDRARVLETGSETCTRYKCFRDVLVTNEYNPDTPDAHQLKYYARGVGNVRVGWAGAGDDTQETLELVSMTYLDRAGMATVRESARKLERRAHALVRAVFGGVPRTVQE